MGPELALTELRGGLTIALLVASPLLLTVLIVGVIVGVIQAATQINEPTIAFVAKAIALAGAMAIAGAWMLAKLVDFTIALFQRIPSLIG